METGLKELHYQLHYNSLLLFLARESSKGARPPFKSLPLWPPNPVSNSYIVQRLCSSLVLHFQLIFWTPLVFSKGPK